ncbi:MAG: hypothetical protein NZ837_05630 [Gammaproteobacteria bacterium]|nr:hypothetical protein [Gammaproteobacteria bacterium]
MPRHRCHHDLMLCCAGVPRLVRGQVPAAGGPAGQAAGGPVQERLLQQQGQGAAAPAQGALRVAGALQQVRRRFLEEIEPEPPLQDTQLPTAGPGGRSRRGRRR